MIVSRSLFSRRSLHPRRSILPWRSLHSRSFIFSRSLSVKRSFLIKFLPNSQLTADYYLLMKALLHFISNHFILENHIFLEDHFFLKDSFFLKLFSHFSNDPQKNSFLKEDLSSHFGKITFDLNNFSLPHQKVSYSQARSLSNDR